MSWATGSNNDPRQSWPSVTSALFDTLDFCTLAQTEPCKPTALVTKFLLLQQCAALVQEASSEQVVLLGETASYPKAISALAGGQVEPGR